jgi:hypothetical protein
MFGHLFSMTSKERNEYNDLVRRARIQSARAHMSFENHGCCETTDALHRAEEELLDQARSIETKRTIKYADMNGDERHAEHNVRHKMLFGFDVLGLCSALFA